MLDDLNAVEAELARLGVRPVDVGEADSIGANDEEDGWVSLGSSASRRDLYWYGRTEDLLRGLRALPAGSGPPAVRSEFRSRYPAWPPR